MAIEGELETAEGIGSPHTQLELAILVCCPPLAVVVLPNKDKQVMARRRPGSRPRTSPARRRNGSATPASTADAGLCAICLEEPGTPRHGQVCDHVFCACCFKSYVEIRVGERAVLEFPCPGSVACPAQVTRAEIAAIVSPAMLQRYDDFLAAERAERDPNTRWCVRPGCNTVCKPWRTELPTFGVSFAVGLASCIGAAPLICPDTFVVLGLSNGLACAATSIAALGVLATLWHSWRRFGPCYRCVCPTCGDSVCYDCKMAWHPGSMCEEVSAQSVVRWTRTNDAGQCPRCGVFIVRPLTASGATARGPHVPRPHTCPAPPIS
jgi:hypothetical protein